MGQLRKKLRADSLVTFLFLQLKATLIFTMMEQFIQRARMLTEDQSLATRMAEAILLPLINLEDMQFTRMRKLELKLTP